MRYLPKHQHGQAVLLVLLSMAVVVTVALSIFSRSITDIKITSTEEDSLRAFSAAEAGIEQVMITGLTDNSITVGDATAVAQKTGFAEGVSEFVLPDEYNSGESATIWFVSHGEDGNIYDGCDATHPCYRDTSPPYTLPLKICWGNDITGSIPAIEASVFYTSPAGFVNTKVLRVTADSDSTRRDTGSVTIPPNKFSSAELGGCTIGTTDFIYQKTLTADLEALPAGVKSGTNGKLYFMKIRMLYNDKAYKIGVSNTESGPLFPSQGIEINSAGTSGEANRKIRVIQGYPEPPEIFNNAVFSGADAGISK